jgi:HEAT repeat protein
VNVSILLVPFQFLWTHVVSPLFKALDRGLVSIAGLFGAFEADMLRRACWMNGLFLGLYAISFLPIPWVPLIALLVGYVGVLAVGRAWVANEKLRTNIVKKLDETDPDTLPDLRAAALLTVLHLLILFPLLLWQLSKQFPNQIFQVSAGASFSDWLEFAFDPYTKPIFDWLEGSGHEHQITAMTGAGSVIMLLKRLTLDFILIQGVTRIFAIKTTIREGVAALKQHPDITIRLGRRAVGPLCDMLRSHEPGDDVQLKSQAAKVLGQLKANSAVPALIDALKDPAAEVRWQAAGALGEIRDPSAKPYLLEEIRDPDPNTARAALDALVAFDAREIVPTLVEWLAGSAPPAGRALAAEALCQLGGKDAVEPLIAALRDSDEEVAKTAAASLGVLRDARGVEPLGKLVTDKTASQWVRYEAAKALEAMGDVTAAGFLQTALTDTDSALRRLAARALGALRDPASGPALIAALGDATPDVREAAARAVEASKPAGGPDALVRLLNDTHAEVRDAAADGLVNYQTLAVPALEKALAGVVGEEQSRIEAILKRLGK